MNEDNEKIEYVTAKDLDKKLDDRFGEQTQVLLTAFDKRFNQMDASLDKRLTESDSRLGKKIDEVDSRLGKKIDEVDSRLGKKIDGVYTLIDGYVKEQEDFKEEFVIVKEEGKQMKQVFKDKLGVEIRAL
jgi:ElaB/YqjD/DUF883 family membrane-anchored ribosome-binding protein